MVNQALSAQPITALIVQQQAHSHQNACDDLNVVSGQFPTVPDHTVEPRCLAAKIDGKKKKKL